MDANSSVSEICSRSRDCNISLAVTDVNLTHAGELKVIRRETSEKSCWGVGVKRALLEGASKGV